MKIKTYQFYHKGLMIYSTDTPNSKQEAEGLIPDILEAQGLFPNAPIKIKTKEYNL